MEVNEDDTPLSSEDPEETGKSEILTEAITEAIVDPRYQPYFSRAFLALYTVYRETNIT